MTRQTTGAHGRDPQTTARNILRGFEERFELGSVPPVPVERIASSLLDLLIEETDDVRTIDGAPTDQGRLSGMLVPETQTIWLDRTEAARSRGRRRFTIAHECGHWLLHVDRSAREVCCRPQDVSEQDVAEGDRVRQLRQREGEANVFARELLMPEPLIIEQAAQTGTNLSAMAARFDVSVPAIRLRLLTLGLLPAWMAKVPIAGAGGRR